jgi:hypothetical protein
MVETPNERLGLRPTTATRSSGRVVDRETSEGSIVMSVIRSAQQQKGISGPGSNDWVEGLRKNCVHEVLAGIYDLAGRCETTPSSVTIFLKEGELRFCIRNQEANVRGYGKLESLDNLVESLENAFETRSIYWVDAENSRDAARYNGK